MKDSHDGRIYPSRGARWRAMPSANSSALIFIISRVKILFYTYYVMADIPLSVRDAWKEIGDALKSVEKALRYRTSASIKESSVTLYISHFSCSTQSTV